MQYEATLALVFAGDTLVTVLPARLSPTEQSGRCALQRDHSSRHQIGTTELVTPATGESPQAEILVGVHGIIDAVYTKELAQKTHRVLEGLARRGLATGGRCFGYRAVRVEGGGAQLEVKTDEAEIIRRIFEMSASGLSYKAIAHQLNDEGIESPAAAKGTDWPLLVRIIGTAYSEQS